MHHFKKQAMKSNYNNQGNSDNKTKQMDTKNECKLIFDFGDPDGYVNKSEYDNANLDIEEDLPDYAMLFDENDVSAKPSTNIDDNIGNYKVDKKDDKKDDKKTDNDIFFQHFIKAMKRRMGENNLKKSSFYLENHTIEFFIGYASLHKMKYSAMVRTMLESVEEAIKSSSIDPLSK